MNRLAATKLLFVVVCAVVVINGIAIGQSRLRRPAADKADSPPQTSSQTSPIVYPPRHTGLRISHVNPSHRSLPCERCHVSVGNSASSRDVLLPKESACVSCHSDKTDRTRASAENCGFCHKNFDPNSPSSAPVIELPAPRIHFSHARHREPVARCVDCHAGIVDQSGENDAGLPAMRVCTKCHDVERRYTCSSCHWSDPAGLVRTKYGEGNLKPPSWLLGMGHDTDWAVRHRWVGADRGSVCASCHKESECVKCHDSRNRPASIHPNDWLALHAQRSRKDAPRCSSCHSTQMFCAECHARLGVSLNSAPDVRSGARFHPTADRWTRGPNLHAKEAKRSLTSCVSCHAERDCVRCHGAIRGIPSASPHPRDFSKKCGTLLDANQRACKACHDDIQLLHRKCE